LKEWPVIWGEAFFGSCIVFFLISILTTVLLSEVALFPIAYALFCMIMTIVMMMFDYVLNDRH